MSRRTQVVDDSPSDCGNEESQERRNEDEYLKMQRRSRILEGSPSEDGKQESQEKRNEDVEHAEPEDDEGG